jgi:hypothetical protein
MEFIAVVQSPQNVHSCEQMNASPSAGVGRLHFSHSLRISRAILVLLPLR